MSGHNPPNILAGESPAPPELVSPSKCGKSGVAEARVADGWTTEGKSSLRGIGDALSALEAESHQKLS